MKIAELAVDRWQLTVVVFLLAVVVGVSAFLSIPRSEDPTFPIPIFVVVAVYPGANPSDMESLVADPLEEELNGLDDLKEIDTRINDGLAVFRVEFDAGVDVDRKYDEVLREVNSVRPRLPADLYALDVDKVSSSEVSVLQLALVSPRAPYATLDALAERLEDRLEAVPGVREASRWAAPEREVRVEVDLGRLAQLKLPVGAVIGAIQGDNTAIPGGSVDVGARRFTVRTSGTYASLDELRATVLRGDGGAVVRLGDLADVRWDYADPTHLARHDGRRAVFVTATMKPGRNVQTVRDAAWQELDRFERTLPAGVTLARAFDQSANVSRRLGRLAEDFAIAILLVLVTLLPLGTRASLIVMVSIPLSLAIGLVLLDVTGFGINQLSIVGFVIALGLLVDDSIVVVENIARFLREGHSRRDAAVLATRQIGPAVLGCTAALVFAFLPLLFLPGGPGDYIRSMPVAVIYTILASLAVSLTIIPFLASRVLREHGDPHGNRVLRAFQHGIHRSYAPVLHRALAHPGRTLLVAGALFAGSLALVPVVGFSLFPKAGLPQFLVTVETPDGSTLGETDRAVRFAERALVGHPEVRTVLANVGRGNPQVYYNVSSRQERSNVGELFVLLNAYDDARTGPFLDSLRRRFAGYPNARIEVKEFENGPPIDAPIALRLTGESLDTLRLLAGRVERLLRATPGTMYVDNPLRVSRSDLAVRVDAQKAGLLGVTPLEVDRTVRLALAGVGAGRFREADGDEHPITVRLPAPGGAGSLDALDAVYVAGAGGEGVPLRQVASVAFEAGPPRIQHHDRQRAVTVTSYTRTGYTTDRVTRAVLASLDSLRLPDGYAVTAAGEIESRQESFGGLGAAIAVAVFGILAILVLEFGTFRSTLIVASVIPLGIVGGVLALWVGGYTLSFTAVIGFVALVGIEIKNSILLVDFTNQLRAEGVPLDAAIERAGEVRFLPIVLTTLTAIGGLLPLALQGSSLYSPLAAVIIGGLVSSTLLSRLVTPVMYKLLAPPVTVAPPAGDGVPLGAQAPGASALPGTVAPAT